MIIIIIIILGCSQASWYGVQSYYTGEIIQNATDSMVSPVNYYDLNFNTILESFGMMISVTFTPLN
jgi:energy-converting hydrogenase Eha subunit F